MNDLTTLVTKCKVAMRRKTSSTDDEIADAINACLYDLQIAGIVNVSLDDPMIIRAIITYVKMHCATFEESSQRASQYKHLDDSYKELKSQLSMATGYTDWGRAPDV